MGWFRFQFLQAAGAELAELGVSPKSSNNQFYCCLKLLLNW